MADERIDFEGKSLELSRVFTPATAISAVDLFCGRINQIRSVVDAINQVGQHAVLYGEKGVGKTSLGRILRDKIRGREPVPVNSVLVNCDSGDDYHSIWNKVFSEMTPEEEQSYREGSQQGAVEFSPYEVKKRFEKLGTGSVVFVILDEFDKLENEAARALIADTIKLFSDRAVHATIIIIGVADDLTDLIREHQSIERCLAQIPMPRMTTTELADIVNHGLEKLKMAIEPDCLWEITGLSKGLPHYTHLLALHAGRQALDDGQLTIAHAHVRKAIESALTQVQESIRQNYDKAIYCSRRGTLHDRVLLACALAESDDFGRFRPDDVCDPLTAIMGEKKRMTTDRFASHLKAFCDPDRGSVLSRIGTQYRWRYRFANPLMQPYVIMRGVRTGLISDERLKALAQRGEN